MEDPILNVPSSDVLFSDPIISNVFLLAALFPVLFFAGRLLFKMFLSLGNKRPQESNPRPKEKSKDLYPILDLSDLDEFIADTKKLVKTRLAESGYTVDDVIFLAGSTVGIVIVLFYWFVIRGGG